MWRFGIGAVSPSSKKQKLDSTEKRSDKLYGVN